MELNWIDFLLLLVILLGVFAGYARGFILSFLDLARAVISVLAALFFYQPVARLLEQINDWTEIWNQPAAFILIFLSTTIIFQIFSVLLLKRLPREIHARTSNRIFGAFPGAANGFVLAAILASFLLAVPFSDEFSEVTRNSRAANWLAGYTEELEARLQPIFGEAVRQTLNRRTTINPDSQERIQLPYKVENPRPRPDLEAEMLNLINRERASAGLEPLEADPELLDTARKHSVDMFARGYFSHYTPENRDPFDRMRADGITYRTAGENLALAPSLQVAHTGLMNSPGHRANILRPQFGRVAIGILDGGRRGLMVTQNFRN